MPRHTPFRAPQQSCLLTQSPFGLRTGRCTARPTDCVSKAPVSELWPHIGEPERHSLEGPGGDALLAGAEPGTIDLGTAIEGAGTETRRPGQANTTGLQFRDCDLQFRRRLVRRVVYGSMFIVLSHSSTILDPGDHLPEDRNRPLDKAMPSADATAPSVWHPRPLGAYPVHDEPAAQPPPRSIPHTYSVARAPQCAYNDRNKRALLPLSRATARLSRTGS